MATPRDIRRRIKSVQNTQQITRAMKMVAAAKLQRTQTRITWLRRYAEEVASLLAGFLSEPMLEEHPLLERRAVRKAGLVMIVGDRGLCGSFNANLFRHAEQHMAANRDIEFQLMPIGQKGITYRKQHELKVLAEFSGIYDELSFHSAYKIATVATKAYAEEELDAVDIVYSRFISAGRHKTVTHRLLPFEMEPWRGIGEEPKGVYIREPSPAAMFDALFSRYLATQVYRALLEAACSLHSARMAAMDLATDNAGEMIQMLTRHYNRARQQSITREILDIVGGSEEIAR